MAELSDAPLANSGRRFGAVAARVLYRAHAVHPDRMPRTGPVVLVSNHTGFLDGPIIFCLAPRTVRFLVKRSYFSSAWGRLLMRMGQIPIEPHTGDRASLSTARELLRRGGALGVFPEGTRGTGTVLEAQQGAAWLALQADAPVLPVATLGTTGAGSGRDSWPLPRARIDVVFGVPFRLEADRSLPNRERLRLATAQLRVRLAQHVSEAVQETGMPLPVGTRDAA